MREVGYSVGMAIFQSEHYENFKRIFELFDKYTIYGAQIYSPELAYQLMEQGVPAVNMVTGTDEILPGAQFRQAYVDGFNEGVAEFKQRWEPSPDILYGPKSEHYLNDLRTAYEVAAKDDTAAELYAGRHNPGWRNQINRVLLMVTNKAVRKQGYYAGLVSKYKELELIHEQLRMETATSQVIHQRRKQKDFDSLRRVESFILAEAYHRGLTEIKTMGKIEFQEYVSARFSSSKITLYQTVRSSYKGESGFITWFKEVKQKYAKDYDYAMKIFNTYYPELS